MKKTHILVEEAERVKAGPMITGRQIRAARGLLGWTPDKLAEQARVSYATVQRAEATADVPNTRGGNLHKIENALRLAGIVFLDEGEMQPGGRGVRLARRG